MWRSLTHLPLGLVCGSDPVGHSDEQGDQLALSLQLLPQDATTAVLQRG